MSGHEFRKTSDHSVHENEGNVGYKKPLEALSLAGEGSDLLWRGEKPAIEVGSNWGLRGVYWSGPSIFGYRVRVERALSDSPTFALSESGAVRPRSGAAREGAPQPPSRAILPIGQPVLVHTFVPH